MRFEIEKKTNANCYVNKLGFKYPILVWNRVNYDLAVKKLAGHPSFGKPSNRFHYNSWVGGCPKVKGFYAKEDISERKWFAGPRKWNDKRIRPNDFWLVFKTEKERTLAIMLLS